MTKQEFAALVAEVRTAQKQYFKTRERDVLMQSKALEKQVDAALAELDAKAQCKHEKTEICTVVSCAKCDAILQWL